VDKLGFAFPHTHTDTHSLTHSNRKSPKQKLNFRFEAQTQKLAHGKGGRFQGLWGKMIEGGQKRRRRMPQEHCWYCRLLLLLLLAGWHTIKYERTTTKKYKLNPNWSWPQNGKDHKIITTTMWAKEQGRPGNWERCQGGLPSLSGKSKLQISRRSFQLVLFEGVVAWWEFFWGATTHSYRASFHLANWSGNRRGCHLVLALYFSPPSCLGEIDIYIFNPEPTLSRGHFHWLTGHRRAHR